MLTMPPLTFGLYGDVILDEGSSEEEGKPHGQKRILRSQRARIGRKERTEMGAMIIPGREGADRAAVLGSEAVLPPR